jgi:hypothetical protein
VTKTWVSIHGLESLVKLLFAHYLSTPLNEMVLENAFMKLVKKIRCETSEYVAMRKISPEGLIHGT